MLVYSRKRKKSPPGPDVASTSKSPSGTSLILWDLQIHTTKAHVLKTFRKQGKPKPDVISFISRNNHTTRYTWCCRLQMASVNEASEILREPTYIINGAEARVTKEKGSEGSEVLQGKHKLIIWNMNFITTKAFKYLRHLFQDCSCADIEIQKEQGRLGYAKLRFRTKEGRKEAISILKSRSKKEHKGWNFEVNDGVDFDDE